MRFLASHLIAHGMRRLSQSARDQDDQHLAEGLGVAADRSEVRDVRRERADAPATASRRFPVRHHANRADLAAHLRQAFQRVGVRAVAVGLRKCFEDPNASVTERFDLRRARTRNGRVSRVVDGLLRSCRGTTTSSAIASRTSAAAARSSSEASARIVDRAPIDIRQLEAGREARDGFVELADRLVVEPLRLCKQREGAAEEEIVLARDRDVPMDPVERGRSCSRTTELLGSRERAIALRECALDLRDLRASLLDLLDGLALRSLRFGERPELVALRLGTAA